MVGQRLAKMAQGVDDLLPGSVAENDVAADVCLLHQFMCLVVECDKVLCCKITGGRERLRHNLGFAQLRIDRLDQGSGRLHRGFLKLIAPDLVLMNRQDDGANQAGKQTGEGQSKEQSAHGPQRHQTLWRLVFPLGSQIKLGINMPSPKNAIRAANDMSS